MNKIPQKAMKFNQAPMIFKFKKPVILKKDYIYEIWFKMNVIKYYKFKRIIFTKNHWNEWLSRN